MAFGFLDLDEENRRLMSAEVGLDESVGVYYSDRLNAVGANAWLALLREACEHGTDATLVDALGEPAGPCLNEFELNPKTGVMDKKVPWNAATTLGEGEFNRFYIRALCVRAIAEDRAIEVYRGRVSSQPDPVSEALIGHRPDPSTLLEDLRLHKGVSTALGLPPHPNSGLTVRLV